MAVDSIENEILDHQNGEYKVLENPYVLYNEGIEEESKEAIYSKKAKKLEESQDGRL